MILDKLLQQVEFVTDKPLNIDIMDVMIDSRKIKPGSLFIAINGTFVDSHIFIPDAVKNGAAAVITEKEIPSSYHIPIIQVQNSRKAYSIISQNYWNRPADNIKLIGITGTTGKTSIAYLIYQILNRLGNKTGLIGTGGCYAGSQKIDNLVIGPVTTPDPMELNKLFSNMKKESCQYIVMEASSFGLDQNRLFGLEFEQAILSNLSYNHHINYHKGMINYIQSKEILFNQLKPNGNGIVNIDTEFIDQFNWKRSNFKTIGIQDNADFIIKNFNQTNEAGISFTLEYESAEYQIISPLTGYYQTYNLAEAFASCLLLNKNIAEIQKIISGIDSIPGRWQFLLSSLPFSVLIDKANTPIALKSIIPYLKTDQFSRRILVFGNVGGGDSKERRMMAALLYNTFEEMILTTDDPEEEDPMVGIRDFLAGIDGYDEKRILIELDRKKAIRFALHKAKKGNLVAILGRGNQKEFLQKGKTTEFDDIAVTQELIKELEQLA